MTIWFCEMEVRCPKEWNQLKQTKDELVRDCDECGKPVHFITTQDQLEAAAMAGTCVAFYENISMPQHLIDQYNRIWDLNKPVPFSKSRMTLGLPSSNKPHDKLRSFVDLFNEPDTKK